MHSVQSDRDLAKRCLALGAERDHWRLVAESRLADLHTATTDITTLRQRLRLLNAIIAQQQQPWWRKAVRWGRGR